MLRPPPTRVHPYTHTYYSPTRSPRETNPPLFLLLPSMKNERKKGSVNLISKDHRRGNNKPTLGINRRIISATLPRHHVRAFLRSSQASSFPRGRGISAFPSFPACEFHKFPDPRIPINPTARVIREGWFPRAEGVQEKYPETRRYYCFHPCIL